MESPLFLLRSNPVAFVLLGISLIWSLTLHEYAHALAAQWQGDRLPRAQGRLSLNPARHLDPIGTLLIFLAGFGWAKPVEFRPEALRSRRFGAALVALAGPGMNLLLSVAAALLYGALARTFGLSPLGVITRADPVTVFFLFFIFINVLLAVFNLMPLPPLDGSRLLTLFLPPRHHRILFFLDRYGFLLLLFVVFFGGTRLVFPLVDQVGSWIVDVTGA